MLLVAAIAAMVSTPSTARGLDGEKLAEDEWVDLELRLGETPRFTIGPPADPDAHWIRLVVEQLGGDVALELRGPDAVLRLADQPLGHHQPELLLVPVTAGKRELEIHALDIDVRVPGRARIAWSGVAHASSGDLAWSEATDLFRRDSEASLAASKLAFLRAANAYEAEGRTAAQARSLLAAGHLAADVGETGDGLAWLREALSLYQRAQDAHGEADAWQQIGHVLRLRGELDEARSALVASLEVSTSTGDRRGQARALLNLGFLDHRASRTEQARSTYERALALLEGAPDPGLEVKLLNNLAGLDFESGRLRQAVASFERLLDVLPGDDIDVESGVEGGVEGGVADPRARARTLINLAAARRLLGRYQETLDAYDAALDTLDGVGEPRLEATILNNLGFTYLRLGDLGRARERFEDALARRRAAEDRRGVATTLNNLGLTAMAENDRELAAARFAEALEIRRQSGDARGQAQSLHHLGRLELARGRLGEARDALEWAMLARRELGDALGEAASAGELAKVHLAAGELDKALGLASRAAETFRRLGSRGDEASALLTQLRGERALGRTAAALESSSRALDIAEALRLEVESPDLRATLLAVVRGLYEETVDLLVEEGDWRGAFAIAERARARAFLDLLLEPGEARLAPDVRQEHRRLVEDLAGLRYAMERARRRGEAPPAQLEAAWREATLQVDRLEHAAWTSSAGSSAETPAGQPDGELDGTPIDLSTFQALIDPGTRVLVYFLAEKRSFLWSIERDRASVETLPPRSELATFVERAIEHFRVFDPRGEAAARRAASEVATRVLPAAALDGAPERLVLVPEGPLLRLPFSALPITGGGAALLVDRFEITYLPSASALPALRHVAHHRRVRQHSGAPASDGGLVLIADPAYAVAEGTMNGLAAPPTPTRLDGSRREAESLAALDGVRVEKLVGPRARRDAVLGDALAPFDYVHFATHATVDAGRPELSALVLSLADAEGRPIDGYLRLADVYGMSLGAELVVLSGCDTGLGRNIRGEGLLGLVRGFFFAGAARVASSLWRVEDDATAELMSRFYRHLLVERETPAAALRRAQLSLRAERRYRHPFFWAAFTVQGDWRPGPTT